jgi:hypothetical protein
MNPSTRYFTDASNVWKFETGKPPMHRELEDSIWEESAFASFEEFEESPGDTREITAEEGEPS